MDNLQPPQRITSVEQFVAKWPNERLSVIQDPNLREMLVDIVNVLWQVEAQAYSAHDEADRARSRATWGLFGGW
jgi:hypothetical protein